MQDNDAPDNDNPSQPIDSMTLSLVHNIADYLRLGNVTKFTPEHKRDFVNALREAEEILHGLVNELAEGSLEACEDFVANNVYGDEECC